MRSGLMASGAALTLDNDTAGSDDERSRLWRIDDRPHELAQLKDRPTIAVGDAVWLSDATLCRFDGALHGTTL